MKNHFNELMSTSLARGAEIVLVVKNGRLYIYARTPQVEGNTFRVIDVEVVRSSESVRTAAGRMLRRMRKDGMVA